MTALLTLRSPAWQLSMRLAAYFVRLPAWQPSKRTYVRPYSSSILLGVHKYCGKCPCVWGKPLWSDSMCALPFLWGNGLFVAPPAQVYGRMVTCRHLHLNFHPFVEVRDFQNTSLRAI